MRRKFLLVCSIFMLFYLSVILGAKFLQAQKIEIKKENGVIVVYNPKKPAPPPGALVKLVLKEDFTIGVKEGDEKHMILEARDMDVDDSGNIYIVDRKAGHIKVFDENGTFVRTVGKKGKGPGETDRPRNIQITAQKEIAVSDSSSRRILFFSLDGKFLREVSSAKLTLFLEPKVDTKGNFVGSYMVFSKEPSSELKKFNKKLVPILDINSLRLARPPVIDARFPRHYWQITKEDNLLWGVSTRYELQVLNQEGKLIKKIIKDYDPVPITKEYKEKWLKDTYGDAGPMPGSKFEWGKHHLAFRDLRLDDEGRIFVQTYERIEEGKGGCYDVFDTEGRYIAKVFLEVKPLVWKRNKMYTIYEDEEGYHFVKRYTVEWK